MVAGKNFFARRAMPATGRKKVDRAVLAGLVKDVEKQFNDLRTLERDFSDSKINSVLTMNLPKCHDGIAAIEKFINSCRGKLTDEKQKQRKRQQ